MTFTVNIYTHKTIFEHNFDRKLGHVSKYGKLFCIFPTGLDEQPVQVIEKHFRKSKILSCKFEILI